MTFSVSSLMVEPTFHACPCGKQSTKVPCWDCVQGRARHTASAARNRDSQLPERYTDISHTQARERVAAFTKWEQLRSLMTSAPNRSFTFVGPSGAGKTTLACYVAAHNSLGCQFVRSVDLERSKKESGFTRSSLLEVAETTRKVLIIDELRDVPGSFQACFDIIDARHNAGIPTYVTTGLTMEQMRTAFGNGLVRRITEPSCATVVKVNE